ncbi:E3 ubiquitin-protein ligase ATL42-like [Carex rostrata]
MSKPDDPPQRSESDEIFTGKVLLFTFLIFALMCIICSCPSPGDRRRCSRRAHWGQPRLVFSNRTEPSPHRLDQNIIDSIPVIKPSLHGDDKVSESCAVCIREFTDGEKLRALPQCSHRFHLECIDMWFASHSTCPLCRADVSSSSPNSDQQVQLGETENKELCSGHHSPLDHIV